MFKLRIFAFLLPLVLLLASCQHASTPKAVFTLTQQPDAIPTSISIIELTETLPPNACFFDSNSVRGGEATINPVTHRYKYPSADVVDMINKPVSEWTLDEQQKFGWDEPVYQQVQKLMNGKWVIDNKFTLNAVFAGKNCGWSALLISRNGYFVWATDGTTDANQEPMFQPNGINGGKSYFEFPGPSELKDGRAKLIVGKDRQVVWVNSIGEIAARFEPEHRWWVMEGMDAPTSTPTLVPTPTQIVQPVEATTLVIKGIKVNPTFNSVSQEWQWVLNGKIERVFDEVSHRPEVYSQTDEGSAIFEVDLDHKFFIDANAQGFYSDTFARKMITHWGGQSNIDVSQVKGFKFKFGFSKYVDVSKWIKGVDYIEDVQPDSFVMRPKMVAGGYIEFAWWMPEIMSLEKIRKYLLDSKSRFVDVDTVGIPLHTIIGASMVRDGRKIDSGWEDNTDPNIIGGLLLYNLSESIIENYEPKPKRTP